jgi:hypothetical protein
MNETSRRAFAGYVIALLEAFLITVMLVYATYPQLSHGSPF